MRKLLAAAVMAAVTIPAVPAYADPPSWAPAYGRRDHDGDAYDQYRDGYRDHDRDGYEDRDRDRTADYNGYGQSYGNNGYYENNRNYANNRYYANNRSGNRNGYRGVNMWQGRDGRYHCRRNDGRTGIVVQYSYGASVCR